MKQMLLDGIRAWLLLALFLTGSAGYALPLEKDRKPEFDHDFVVGLALSGGGAAGLAHIGVLKVFEEAGIPVDLVTGTSTGSIIGALYAMGYSPEQMEDEVRRTDWRQIFEERIQRQHLPMDEKRFDGLFTVSFPVEGGDVKLPTGLVSGNRIFNMLARLTWQYHDQDDFLQLPRPFLCIATDLESGEQVILDRGFLPDAIRASMSIPSIFEPVWLDGRYLVDGGLMNNLPVQEAFDLGADFVIAVNASSDLKPADELLSLPDILTQTIAVGMRTSMEIQGDKADYFIRPDLSQYTTLSFGEVEGIIKAGEASARARMDEIRALADSLNRLRSTSNIPPIPGFEPLESFRVRSVSFDGLKTVPESHILSKLQIYSGNIVDEETITEGMMRLNGMQRFERVNYRLQWNDSQDEADLIIYLYEQTANMIQMGIFHNNMMGPAILFNASFRKLVFPASTARLNMRMGFETLAEMQYFNYIGIEPRLTFHGAAGYREHENDIYRNGRREAGVRTDVLFAEALTGPLYASVFHLGAGYRLEYFNLSESIGFLDIPSHWNSLHLLVGELEFDNMNRSDLPTSGFHFMARTELALPFLPNELSFGRIHGFWKGYFPASSRLTIIQRLLGGYSYGDKQPLHYRYYAGGYQSFAGYLKDALSGNNLLMASTAAQYRFYGSFYVTPAFHVGSTYDRMNHSVFESLPKWGWAATVSWKTMLGPIEAALAGSHDNILLLEFQIGRNF